MKTPDRPTVTTLLDTDFYKFSMGQAAFRLHRNAPVTYGFKNRTSSVALPTIVDEGELREHLAHIRSLRFSASEIAYLKYSAHLAGLFGADYLDFLSGLQLPEVQIEKRDQTYRIEVAGSWPEAMPWETLILCTVNELYCRARLAADGIATETAHAEGELRLRAKTEVLNRNPQVRFMEFGTRRRFSRDWQMRVVEFLDDNVPSQLVGTSNVAIARSLGIKPIGTMAHEMFMVYQGIYGATDEGLVASHNRVLDDWRGIYGGRLNVALTDTYTSDVFFRLLTRELAEAYSLRQDSGDPLEFGERAIAFYRAHGIDPAGKTAVFSDGLDLETILKIEERFRGRLGILFGWGTNLTNDLGVPSLSLVVKAIEACGRPLVKLSDNPAKATGPAEAVERVLRAFGARTGSYVECIR